MNSAKQMESKIDYAAAANERAERERKKQEIAELKRQVVACKRKLEKTYSPNWHPPLIGNGEELLRNEMRRLEGQISKLSEGL